MTYSYLAGCYPIKSAHGNQYILICYEYYSNTVLSESLPSISGAYINKRVQKLLETLTTSGHNPKLRIIYNEFYYLLKKTLLQQNISYQIVPLHIHRRIAAERSI